MAQAAAPPEPQGFVNKMLGTIEKVGNKVPSPVMMFLYLIIGVIVLSAVLDLAGVQVTEDIIVPKPELVEQDWLAGGTTSPQLLPVEYSAESGYELADPTYLDDYSVETVTISIRSLLSVDGIRFIFTSFVSNFAGFSVVAVIFVSMIGIGVSEHAGFMDALIRKLVGVAPGSVLTFVIILVGGLSSIATDAGYLILIPLAAAAFLSIKRHPLLGLAAAYAGVSAAFSVNILLAPLDAMLTEMTNEAIAIADPSKSITITANLYFSIASTILMAIVMTIIAEKVTAKQLGNYDPALAIAEDGAEEIDPAIADKPIPEPEAESRGLRWSVYGLIGMIVLVVALTAPHGAPLRDPIDGKIIGNTPFMDSLIFIITLIFLVMGIGYGYGAGTFKSSNDVITGVTKAFAGLAGLIFMLLMISQFIALFNWSHMPNVIAGKLANWLGEAGFSEIPLLIGFILIIALLDIIIPGSMPKWAIFAPIFVPLFMHLGVAPQTVLAAYRIGDSPMNVITPLMVYLPFILVVAQRYVKNTGIGTIISLMIPYTLVVLILWIVFFVAWYVIGIPLGPGYSVGT
ncbi:MAG: AbgT family transporter [Thermomicrobiales bacterium]|nr:AbgT family transporter [Thermomicrobiales bacterium]